MKKKERTESHFMWIDAKRITEEKKYVIAKDTCTLEQLKKQVYRGDGSIADEKMTSNDDDDNNNDKKN